jgi:hypothetical protein
MRSGITSFGAALLLLAGCAGSVDDAVESDAFDQNESESLAQEVVPDDPADPATPTEPTEPTTPSNSAQPKIPEITGTSQ